MSETPRSRTPLTWPAVVAATVLALVAAGMVLFLASDDGDGEVDVGAGDTGAITLRPADDVPQGDPLDIDLSHPDGGQGTLRQELDGEPAVVNLFASWCPPCVAEMPEFEEVSQELAGTVRFFGVAVNDRPEDAARIVEETGITYDWARDPLGDVAGAFGVTTMPSTLLVGPDGEVAHAEPGAVDADELRSLIEEHLAVAG